MKQPKRPTRKAKIIMAELAAMETPLSFESPDSASIEKASYDPKTETMLVTLRPGKTYGYGNIPAATWKQFVDAPSKGKFFQSAIRPNHLGRKQ